jgi:hypothetical protein
VFSTALHPDGSNDRSICSRHSFNSGRMLSLTSSIGFHQLIEIALAGRCSPKRSLAAAYQFGKQTVHLDGCVEVEAAYYGAPPGRISRQVDMRWDAMMYVRLIDPRTGELLREHLSHKRGGHRIRDEDRLRRTPVGRWHCRLVLTRPAGTSAHSPTRCTNASRKRAYAASRAC